ncbi:MAG: hypothetical protein ABIQ44_15755 [Chloroflexia bacterium]
MASLINVDAVSMVPQRVREEYIQAMVAKGTAQAACYSGFATARDVTRSQVRLMRAMLEVAKDCNDADHYLVCKSTLDTQAVRLLRS